MTAVHRLLKRNRQNPAPANLPIEPKLRTLILTCSDQRSDPAQALGLDAGEAVVIRNAGGRVTPAVLTDLAILSTVGGIEGLRGDFELIVMHHTDCGTSRLVGDQYHGLLAQHFGIAPEEVPERRVDDPAAAVTFDVGLLREHPLIPETMTISGVLLDIDSGQTQLIVPPLA